jgi:hypothetical protein
VKGAPAANGDWIRVPSPNYDLTKVKNLPRVFSTPLSRGMMICEQGSPNQAPRRLDQRASSVIELRLSSSRSSTNECEARLTDCLHLAIVLGSLVCCPSQRIAIAKKTGMEEAYP